jgi:acetylglutamate kinase
MVSLDGRPPAVIKLGGRALEARGALRELAAELAALPGPMLVVHGGGAEVSSWCGRLGLPQRFESGLRVTDPETLEVVVAVLAGLANKRLVAALRDAGVDALGLAAVDGGIVEADRHPDHERLGAVGRVRAVNRHLLDVLLAQGRLPVLASIAGRDGRLLNLNADDLAAALGAALGSKLVVLLTDAPGLALGGAVVPRLGLGEVAAALAGAEVEGGMRAKLHAAARAVAAGVERVQVAGWSGPGTIARLLAGTGGGTVVEAGPAPAHARG